MGKLAMASIKLFFCIDAFTGTPHARNPEGELSWHDIDRLDDLPLWEGDRHFLPLVFDDDPRPFHGHMVYDGDRMVSFHCTR